MGGKHRAWRTHWRIDGARLIHSSGAAFVVTEGVGYTDIEADDATLGAYQAAELARGVPVHDLADRFKRLAREAGELWQSR